MSCGSERACWWLLSDRSHGLLTGKSYRSRHWRHKRTNNPLERLDHERHCRTRGSGKHSCRSRSALPAALMVTGNGELSVSPLRQQEKCRSQGRVREILPDWSGCLRKCAPDPVHCQLLCLCPRFGLSLQTPCGAEKNFSNLWGIWWGKSAHNEKTLTLDLFLPPQGDLNPCRRRERANLPPEESVSHRNNRTAPGSFRTTPFQNRYPQQRWSRPPCFSRPTRSPLRHG